MEKCACSHGPLMLQIKAVMPEEFIEPQKADGTFEPIEVMNHFEKQAFTIMMRLDQRIRELVEAAKGGHLKANEIGPVRAEARVLVSKRDHVEGEMFFSIRDRLNCWDKQLDVSQGWKVIIPEERETVKVLEVVIPTVAALSELMTTLVNISTEDEENIPPAVVKNFSAKVDGTGTVH